MTRCSLARVRTPVMLLLGREFGLQYRYSLGTGSGSDSSDVTPWAPVRTPVTLLLGRGFGLQRRYLQFYRRLSRVSTPATLFLRKRLIWGVFDANSAFWVRYHSKKAKMLRLGATGSDSNFSHAKLPSNQKQRYPIHHFMAYGASSSYPSADSCLASVVFFV